MLPSKAYSKCQIGFIAFLHEVLQMHINCICHLPINQSSIFLCSFSCLFWSQILMSIPGWFRIHYVAKNKKPPYKYTVYI